MGTRVAGVDLNSQHVQISPRRHLDIRNEAWADRAETRFASFSSVASTSGTPRTFFDPSSTPMTTIPPPVFAHATRHLRTLSGDDKSRLYSRVFPSWRFSSSTSLTTPHSTRKHYLLRGFRVRRHRQAQNNGSQAAAMLFAPHRPWQNRVKTLLTEAIGVSFERKADSPNY
jgi:hypothetical protein